MVMLAACSSPTTNPPSQPTAAVRRTPTPTPTPTPAPTTSNGTNLIANGDAESGPGTMDGSMPVTTIPGWTASGNFDVVAYGATSSYPVDTDPGPQNRGKNFFAGGPSDAVSTGTQTIDVSNKATAIDSGSASYTLSGWLGGYAEQTDNAVLLIQFEDASGKALGQTQIGPNTPDQRNGVTGFVQQSTQGTAPKGTRKILVTLTMTRVDGTANDGYADNLSLTLGSGSGSGNGPANSSTYKNELFSVHYPSAWQEADSPGNAFFSIFTNPSLPLEQFQVIQSGPAGQAYPSVEDADDSLCGLYGGPTGATTHLTISSQQWTREICAKVDNPLNPTGLVETVIYKGKFYTIAYGAPQASFDKDWPTIFTPMEQSFTFLS
jgi:hypothetical protein